MDKQAILTLQRHKKQAEAEAEAARTSAIFSMFQDKPSGQQDKPALAHSTTGKRKRGNGVDQEVLDEETKRELELNKKEILAVTN